MPCTSSQHLPKAKKELINKHPSSSVQAAVNTRGVSVAGVSRSAHSIIEIRQVDEPQPSVPPDRHSDKHLKERRRKKNTFEQEKGKKNKKKERGRRRNIRWRQQRLISLA